MAFIYINKESAILVEASVQNFVNKSDSQDVKPVWIDV